MADSDEGEAIYSDNSSDFDKKESFLSAPRQSGQYQQPEALHHPPAEPAKTSKDKVETKEEEDEGEAVYSDHSSDFEQKESFLSAPRQSGQYEQPQNIHQA